MAVLTEKSTRSKTSATALKKYFQAKLEAELGPHDLKHALESAPATQHGGSVRTGLPTLFGGKGRIIVLDVRSAEGYAKGHIPGALNIPFENLPSRLRELDRGREYVTYCWNPTCLLCTRAAYYLAGEGFTAREMIGGIEAWKAAGFPVEQ